VCVCVCVCVQYSNELQQQWKHIDYSRSCRTFLITYILLSV